MGHQAHGAYPPQPSLGHLSASGCRTKWGISIPHPGNACPHPAAIDPSRAASPHPRKRTRVQRAGARLGKNAFQAPAPYTPGRKGQALPCHALISAMSHALHTLGAMALRKQKVSWTRLAGTPNGIPRLPVLFSFLSLRGFPKWLILPGSRGFSKRSILRKPILGSKPILQPKKIDHANAARQHAAWRYLSSQSHQSASPRIMTTHTRHDSMQRGAGQNRDIR